MNASGFCHWLQGVLDMSEIGLSNDQVNIVQTRLSEAFVEDIDKTFPAEIRPQLAAAHKGLAHSSLHGEYDPKKGVPRC